MSPWVGISLLIIIIIITLFILYFTWWLFTNYQTDRNNINDCKNEIKKLTLLILADEGLPIQEPVVPVKEVSRAKQYNTLLNLFGPK